MRTNLDTNISTDWRIHGIVKPEHVNALTGAVQYDYVVTQKMLENKSGIVNVDELLGTGKINATTGIIHVLINAVIPDNVILHFPSNSVGGPSGDLEVHVHCISPFKASFSESSIPNISHYFHTHGKSEAVTLLSIPKNIRVGSFIMQEPISLPAGSTFAYEVALQELPVVASSQTSGLKKEKWMSNSVDGGATGSRAIAVLLNYKRLGPARPLPNAVWPLVISWKGNSSHLTGVVTADTLFPYATPVGTKVGPGYLVPRDKSEYGGKLLPQWLTSTDGALQFRSPDFNWNPNVYMNGDVKYGFTLTDSFFGCLPARNYGYNIAQGVKVSRATTQLDVYTTYGLAFLDTGFIIPQQLSKLLEINVKDMEEGQVVELNIHIVDFPPAKQALHDSLGGEHFIPEWSDTASYTEGALVSVTHATSSDEPYYLFYRAIQGDTTHQNTNYAPASYIGTWWEEVTIERALTSGGFHAATPFNANISGELAFIAHEDASSAMPILAWGYGTPPNIDRGPKANTSDQLKITFSKPYAWANTPEATLQEVPTIPIAASAKIIFTKITQESQACILVLTGGYCAPPYPNY